MINAQVMDWKIERSGEIGKVRALWLGMQDVAQCNGGVEMVALGSFSTGICPCF